MNRGVWRGARRTAIVVAVASFGCAGMRQESQSPSAQQVRTPQQESEQAIKRAQEAQKQATEQAERAAQAQGKVRELQRKLTQAQQTAREEQAQAEQLQREANRVTQQSASRAQESQQQAQQALARQGRRVERDQQEVRGVVLRANAGQLLVKPPNGDAMSFHVGDQTRVQIDGRAAHAADIRQGEDALVAYRMSGSQPVALTVEVATGHPEQAPASTGTGSQQGQ